MSDIGSRTPVLVGAGQFIQRPENPVEALEPVAMMGEALANAAQDAGAPGLPARASHTWVIKGAWPYPDPAALLNQRFGAAGKTGLSTDGGNTPQSLVNLACNRIAAGEADVVLIAGAEGIWSRRRARRADQRIPYTDQTGAVPGEVLGRDVIMNNKVEVERGFRDPINLYPVFESAFRASRGETMEGHRDRVAAMWEKFNQAAVANPYSWIRTPMTAEEIRNPSPTNRFVGFPYTKSMNSNWDLDLAAALIVCSAEAATAAGVPTDRWLFPHAGTDARDTDYVSNRGDLHSSPAIRVAGRRVMELAGVGVDDIDHVDLYSCFPSAVQISATELGLGLDRDLTLTGGLTFAGGPLNNYVTHSIATMAGVLRDNPGTFGLCSANGGYLTKHAFGIYSTEPPADGFRHQNCQDEIDRFPSVELDANYTGSATVEAYTVMHGRTGPTGVGPEVALAAVRTPNGRQWARSTDPELMAEMTRTEHIGTGVVVNEDFEFAPA
ncbi:acetyl-CoA acetyltransferase [Candidatus Poriferisodalis sp.]|uniref:acetyl-CoA acetyltransferase n=1 Tax=Candidatus Poriferisodalis sp. TaxID=3101277 RepID=UPI003B52102E